VQPFPDKTIPGRVDDDVLASCRVIAVVRAPGGEWAAQVGTILADAGIGAIEVALGPPGGLSAVTRLRVALAGTATAVGAGVVRTPADVADAANAGAQFLTTASTRAEVVAEAYASALPLVCGAMTPTEAELAWSLGAAYVNVFAAPVLGPAYVLDLAASLPDVRLVASGTITVDCVGEYAAAGAVAVGVASPLVDPRLVAAEDWAALRCRARAFAGAAAAAWRGEAPDAS
jgi:2-dehydro-3-deoxyphosphogluconate aldolase / (4S)-4-hydroxy-2-oxoglutarate aldolase